MPQDAAIVECGTPPPVADSNGAALGEAAIVSYAPERVEIRAQVASYAILVLNDAFYQGWTARVDGSPVAIMPANYAVRGVPLPPGDHTILFTYRTPGLVLGGCLSSLAVLGSTLVAAKRCWC